MKMPTTVKKNHITYIENPLGIIEIKNTNKEIVLVKVVENKNNNTDRLIPDPTKGCIKQLDEYFEGKRIVFQLSLQQNGTVFQLKAYHQLSTIPYGQTISYKQLAGFCMNEKAMRAVGSANEENQHWIIIPCHRVITADGALGSYTGDLWRKNGC